MKKPIKGVIFDLDDTLYDCNYTNNTASIDAVCTYAAQHLLHLPVEKVREAFDRARLSIKDRMLGDVAGQHNRMLYFQRTLENLQLSPVSHALEMYDYFWNDFLSRIILFDGASETLKYLHNQGISIGICTDMTVHIQHRKMRALGIAPYTDMLITSEEVGAEKPNPVIYMRACEKMGLNSGECIFIGDSLKKDVLGPITCGLQGIWFREENFCDREKDGLEAAKVSAEWSAGKATKGSREQETGKQMDFPEINRVENHRELLTLLKQWIGETA